MRVIYLDNAATSDPKPSEVIEAVGHCLRENNANPGRGGHRPATAAARAVYGARVQLAELLGVGDPARLIFTAGCTDALHLAIRGLLDDSGGAVACSAYEHNATWRPLRDWARRTGGKLVVVPPAPDGGPLDLDAWAAAVPSTRLCVLTAASNVTGALFPVREAAAICRAHGVPLVVDAAQSAGHIPVGWDELGATAIVTSGHKGLLGPQGIGLLQLAPGAALTPVRLGGTGGNSEQDVPPEDLPERYEAGTVNTPGIVGLGAAARVLAGIGLERRRAAEIRVLDLLLEGLAGIPGVRVLGSGPGKARVGCVSVTLDGWDPARVAQDLDEHFGIAVRAGLHCAPQAHRTAGTFPDGAVRISPGWRSTEADIEAAVSALKWLARHREVATCAST